ncbi:hypothetical protein F4777DRAFT_577828 [Nemania sp. FL0916]|nr:hypothetical protein F4777DRAFT_577828 [Nemania sp. FL0916]
MDLSNAITSGSMGTAIDPALQSNYETFHRSSTAHDPARPSSTFEKVIGGILGVVALCFVVFVLHGLFNPPKLPKY